MTFLGGIDGGGTHLRAVVADEKGREIARTVAEGTVVGVDAASTVAADDPSSALDVAITLGFVYDKLTRFDDAVATYRAAIDTGMTHRPPDTARLARLSPDHPLAQGGRSGVRR